MSCLLPFPRSSCCSATIVNVEGAAEAALLSSCNRHSCRSSKTSWLYLTWFPFKSTSGSQFDLTWKPCLCLCRGWESRVTNPCVKHQCVAGGETEGSRSNMFPCVLLVVLWEACLCCVSGFAPGNWSAAGALYCLCLAGITRHVLTVSLSQHRWVSSVLPLDRLVLVAWDVGQEWHKVSSGRCVCCATALVPVFLGAHPRVLREPGMRLK